jgi:predicted PurR-regulated permease PerM
MPPPAKEEEVETIDVDALKEYVKGGSQRWLDNPYESLVVTQGCHIVCAVIAVCCACIDLKFVLIPMFMAYFVTFLLGPIMDAMEHRPYQLGSTFYCKENYLHPARKRYARTSRGECLDMTLLVKLPHMLAVVVCLLFCALMGSTLISTLSSSFGQFAEDQAAKVEKGGKPMGVALSALLNAQIDELEASGVLLKREFICDAADGTELAMRTIPTEEDGLEYLRLFIYRDFFSAYPAEDGEIGSGTAGETSFNCTRKKIFGTSEGYTPDELLGYIGAIGKIVNDFIFIVMLALYILLERQAGATVSGDHIVAEQIEAMIKNYVSLKFALSALTGTLTAIFLVSCQVPLGTVFGLLAFLLNFIPNVGSIIAMFLPIPIIILSDEMSYTAKVIALLGPASVQGYIGNVLEPVAFGASLNLTAISILIALVFFSAVWGLYGAVLSVPILGAVKIVLHHTEHPMAKAMLPIMREDKTLDFENDHTFLETKASWDKLTDMDSIELKGTVYEKVEARD